MEFVLLLLHIHKLKMKTSINYLPEKKRDELRRIVKCVLDVLPDCEMIILYGSYARNTYVDYDQRIEYGVPTCFMSDYDILVVTKVRFHNYTIDHLLNKAADNYYKGKYGYDSTTVQFINESIDDLNKAILKSRYFYTDIKKEGVMLYNSGRYKLARRRKLNFQEIKELAQEYYNERFQTANEFLHTARLLYKEEYYKMASFNLHQACENLYNSIILTFTLYSPKEHSLLKLSAKAKTHSLEPSKAFPRDTKEEKRLFELLQDAYVQARYNSRFVVAGEDIETLLSKVELLRDITKQCCEERIRAYEAKKR